jgi:phosphatidylglycerophosphate synthase
MELEAVSLQDARRARLLQSTANGLCYLRMAAGPLIGAYIARERQHRSWKLAGLMGAVAITDALDGKLARKAAALDPRVKSQRGAWLDQMADKVFTHGVLGGMSMAAGQVNKTKAAVIAANQVTQLARDVWITNVRKTAAEHNVPTNAQTLGKVKTGVLLASTIALASPLADIPYGESAAITGLTAGSTLSVISGISLANSLHAGIDVNEQAQQQPAAYIKEPTQPPTLLFEA